MVIRQDHKPLLSAWQNSERGASLKQNRDFAAFLPLDPACLAIPGYWAATKTGGPDNYHRRDNVIFFIIIHLQYKYFGHDNVMQILAEHIVIQIVIVERKEEMGRISILYFWLIFYFVFIMKSPRF